MFPAFPKLFAIGHRSINTIFDDIVEVTEKIDGSQFAFGVIGGELIMRSKGTRVYPETADKLFKPAVAMALRNHEAGLLPEGFVFYGETLHAPRHNVLAYDRVPLGNFALFGVLQYPSGIAVDDHARLVTWADILKCEVVPLIYQGVIGGKEQLLAMLERVSVLGGQKIEGVVVKRYTDFMLGGDLVSVMGGKFVSEAFKEVHSQTNYGASQAKDAKQELFDKYRTIPRWQKAVQHLRERGLITDSPKDIGPLLKEVNVDVLEECEEEIKDALWGIFRKEFLRNVTRGLPEWYKEQLLNNAWDNRELGADEAFAAVAESTPELEAALKSVASEAAA